MKRHNDSGMSGLDLVTVLLVVGALASITIPVFMSSSARVQAAVCASNRAAIMARATSYEKLKGVYPTTMAELVDKAYFAVIPTCPGHGVYVYNSVNTGGNGEVYCSVHYAGKDAGTTAQPVAEAPAPAAASGAAAAPAAAPGP
jgi:type II secretory pathway pseudopilin PulG